MGRVRSFSQAACRGLALLACVLHGPSHTTALVDMTPEPTSDLDRETRPEWLEEFAAQGVRQLEDILTVHAAFQAEFPERLED